jgi:hypothetical protein
MNEELERDLDPPNHKNPLRLRNGGSQFNGKMAEQKR